MEWKDVKCSSLNGPSSCRYHKRFYNDPQSKFLDSLPQPKPKRAYVTDERNVLDLFKSGAEFLLQGEKYISTGSFKPRVVSGGGEPKTDVFVYAKNISTGEKHQIKISYKKNNSDFLENKLSADRAEALLGENFRALLKESFIGMNFDSKVLHSVDKTNYVLGYRVDIMNKPGRNYYRVALPDSKIRAIYSGSDSSLNKTDCMVGNRVVSDSGVANFMLVGDSFANVQAAADCMVTMDDYITNHNEVFIAFKAVSFRTERSGVKREWDGDRPLAFHVNWSYENGELAGAVDIEKVYSARCNRQGEYFRELTARKALKV